MPIEDSIVVTFTAVIPDDPAVKSVKLSGPTEANVGEPVSFTAIVYDQYDEPMPDRGVEWALAPEGIASILDQSPGSCIVQATEAGTVAVTGTVIETQPEPTPGDQWPPEGYSDLVPPVDFSTGWPEGWSVREVAMEGLALFELIDGENPITGGPVARHSYLPGNTDGGGSGYLISPRGPSGVTDMIIEEVLLVSENFQGHQSGVNKNGYTIDDDRDGVDPAYGTKHPHMFMTDGVGEGRLQPGIIGQDVVENRRKGDFTIQRGQWYRFRYRFLMGDETHGGYWIWAAPLGNPLQLVGQWTLATTTTARDGFLDRVQIRPIWGGRGDMVVNRMFKQWAQVRVAGR